MKLIINRLPNRDITAYVDQGIEDVIYVDDLDKAKEIVLNNILITLTKCGYYDIVGAIANESDNVLKHISFDKEEKSYYFSYYITDIVFVIDRERYRELLDYELYTQYYLMED